MEYTEKEKGKKNTHYLSSSITYKTDRHRHTHLLLRLPHRNPSTNHTRQLLTPNAIQQPNPPANRADQQHRKPSQQPKRHADILLLARGTTPLHGLHGSVLVLAHNRPLAPAGVAVAGAVGGGAVFLVAGAVAGAVVCRFDAA